MRRALKPLLFVLLVVGLFRYVWASCYVHPFADDFSYAVAGMHNSLGPRLLDEYRFWNGRWFSNILVLRGPLVLGLDVGLWLYRMVPLLLIVLTWFGAYRLGRAWVDVSAAPRKVLLLATGWFTLLYLHLMPDPSEGIYWYTGAVSYQLPGALMLLVAAAWCRSMDADRQGRKRAMWFAVFTAVVICGCSELHMVFMVLLHAALLVRSLKHRSVPPSVALLSFAVVLIAAAVMVFAPGNAGRAAQFPHKEELGRTLLWGAAQTGRFLFTWILSPGLLLVSLLFLSCIRYLHVGRSALAVLNTLRVWQVAAFTLVLVFASMSLPYWSTGLLGQHRTVNAALLLFLPCWFLLLLLVHKRWPVRPLASVRSPGWFRPAVVGLLAVTILCTGSGGALTADLLSGRMQQRSQALDERYAMVRLAIERGDGRVVVPPLVPTVASLRFLDADTDPGHWINCSMAQYFGAPALELSVGPVRAPEQVR